MTARDEACKASARRTSHVLAVLSDFHNPDMANALSRLLSPQGALDVEMRKRTERMNELNVLDAADLLRRAHEQRPTSPWNTNRKDHDGSTD